MTYFLGAKRVQNDNSKSYDELVQHDNKMRIWARSENSEEWKIYEWVTKHNANANDNIHVCVTLDHTDVNDNIHDCLAPHDAYTCNHIQLSVVRTFLGCVDSSSRTHALWLKFESFMSSPWPSTCVRSLHHDPPFLLLALPSAPFLLPQLLEVCGKPAQLLQTKVWILLTSSAFPQVMSPRPMNSVEPYVQLLNSPPLFCNKVSSADPATMTLHSKTCSACRSLRTRRRVCQSVVVTVRQNRATCWR